MLGIYGTVYNSADTVRQTVEDLKSKLKEDFILVVTDNYSTDGTYEILKEYDFIDAIKAKSTRGKGRQIALQHLIKNYPEVDFIFYIDFDLEFPDYLQKMIDNIKKRYEFGEFYANIASYDTYRDAIKKVVWPDMNVGEDHYENFQLIRSGYKVYRLLFPIRFNQIREEREKKYVKKPLIYFKRWLRNNIKDWTIFTLFRMSIKIWSIKPIEYIENKFYNLFPEDLGLDKNLLFIIIKSYGKIPEGILKALREHKGKYKFIEFKPKSKIGKYIIIYRNLDDIIKNQIEFYEKSFGHKIFKHK